MRRVLDLLENLFGNVWSKCIDGSTTYKLWKRPKSHRHLGLVKPATDYFMLTSMTCGQTVGVPSLQLLQEFFYHRFRRTPANP